MKRGVILITLFILVLISLAVSVYFLYWNIRTCQNQECFNQALVKCSPRYWTNENSDTIIKYKILGTEGDKCEVNVQILQIKKGLAELTNLEGKSMVCALDYGIVTDPEKNLGICHGILKETIQEIIIKRMHAQIVENIGKISAETTKII